MSLAEGRGNRDNIYRQHAKRYPRLARGSLMFPEWSATDLP